MKVYPPMKVIVACKSLVASLSAVSDICMLLIWLSVRHHQRHQEIHTRDQLHGLESIIVNSDEGILVRLGELALLKRYQSKV